MAFCPAATRPVGKGKQWRRRGGAGGSQDARGGGGTADEGREGEGIGARGGSGEGWVADNGRKEEAADGARTDPGTEGGWKEAAGGEAGRSDVDRNTVFVRNVSFKASQNDVGVFPSAELISYAICTSFLDGGNRYLPLPSAPPICPSHLPLSSAPLICPSHLPLSSAPLICPSTHVG
ncbi:unnamed protein product [Closterium sp. Naga37s-1]|nr:unnamed protein product [Closterium sp. Naga37s-1]